MVSTHVSLELYIVRRIRSGSVDEMFVEACLCEPGEFCSTKRWSKVKSLDDFCKDVHRFIRLDLSNYRLDAAHDIIDCSSV
jgi:hypothetical protein